MTLLILLIILIYYPQIPDFQLFVSLKNISVKMSSQFIYSASTDDA